MKHKIGKFYGIGVGPGDPELISIKAVNILKHMDVIFSASSKDQRSISMDIARPYLPSMTPVKKLLFPMVKDKNILDESWEKNTLEIINEVEQGKNAAFLTLGDPLTYSTYGYIIKRLKKIAPHIDIETIPGITSYQAAAARINTPLAEGEESLLILSGSKGGDHLKRLEGQADNIVLLKAYRQIKDICSTLREMDMLKNTTAIMNCSTPEERIVTNIEELIDAKPDYLTLLIIKKGKTD